MQAKTRQVMTRDGKTSVEARLEIKHKTRQDKTLQKGGGPVAKVNRVGRIDVNGL